MTSKPTFELKNVKYAEFASEETSCYEASLYMDGKKIAVVSNDGHGGCDMQHPVNGADIREINDLVKRTFPRWGTDLDTTGWADPGDGNGFETDLEMVCADLLERWLTLRDLKRAMKRKVLYVENGKLMETGFKHKGPITPAHLEYFTKHKPEAMMLNGMNDDAIYDAVSPII